MHWTNHERSSAWLEAALTGLKTKEKGKQTRDYDKMKKALQDIWMYGDGNHFENEDEIVNNIENIDGFL
jgi:hypothetical protein